MEMVADVFHTLKKLLASKGYATTVGDEGGFAPAVSSNKEAMQLLVDAINASRFTYGTDVKLGLDVASSEFYKDGKYEIKSDGLSLTSDEMVDWIAGLKDEFDIVSIFIEMDDEEQSSLRGLGQLKPYQLVHQLILRYA